MPFHYIIFLARFHRLQYHLGESFNLPAMTGRDLTLYLQESRKWEHIKPNKE